MKRTAIFYFEAVLIILAIVLVLTGTSAHKDHSEWLIFAGLGLFVLAGVPALRALSGPSTSDDLILERKSSGKRISNGLVALSSAAVLVVYAAGYNRTSSAADQFAAQTAAPRHRTLPAAAVLPDPNLLTARPIDTAAPTNVPQLQQTVAKPVKIAAAQPVVSPSSNAVADEKTPVIEPAAAEVTPSSPVQPEPVSADQQAPQAQPAAVQVTEVKASPYMDGTYFGWGSCRHGSLQVKVVIEAGRIASADINECRTRYSCSVIRTSPPQVVSRQTPETIDNVSGATQSVDAYYFAVTEALKQAVRSSK